MNGIKTLRPRPSSIDGTFQRKRGGRPTSVVGNLPTERAASFDIFEAGVVSPEAAQESCA